MLIESTLDGALLLASHGLHVVRLHYPIFREDRIACSCGNPKCTAQGKHPVGMQWGKTATTDADTIRDLWRESDWNVGVLMGTGHGIPEDQAVIDIEDDTLEGRNLADALLRDYPTVSLDFWTDLDQCVPISATILLVGMPSWLPCNFIFVTSMLRPI